MATVGIDAKIKRAEEVLESLKRDIQSFSETNGKFITHEVHTDTREQIWIFRGETPHTPIEWGIKVGEFAYHLRSSLDHLIWQLVLANSNTPSSGNAFPIFINPTQFQNRVKALLKGVSPRVETIVESLQPYHGGDWERLWRLHQLCNIDKHRHINMTVMAVSGSGRVGSSDPRFTSLIAHRKIIAYLGPLEKDAVFLRIKDLEVEVEPNFSAQVSFGQIEPGITDLPVSNTLIVTHYQTTQAINALIPHLSSP